MLNHFPTSSSGRKKDKLPYGVCTLRFAQHRIVQHIYGAIQEYAGFDEPRWLTARPRKPAPPQPSSSSSSAFWAWRRFSAWSQTAERSP